MKRRIDRFRSALVGALLIALGACSTTPPAAPDAAPAPRSTDYDRDFRYPAETNRFRATGIKIFDAPHLGVAVSYADKSDPSLKITTYVYPIQATGWENTDKTLTSGVDEVLAEIDRAIEQGYYRYKQLLARESHRLEASGRVFDGQKAKILTELQDVARALDSEIYLFIVEDKFVKFRITTWSAISPDWMGDAVVAEILPGLDVPPESPYMRARREAGRQRASAERLAKGHLY